jgi:hypothetical protein
LRIEFDPSYYFDKITYQWEFTKDDENGSVTLYDESTIIYSSDINNVIRFDAE